MESTQGTQSLIALDGEGKMYYAVGNVTLTNRKYVMERVQEVMSKHPKPTTINPIEGDLEGMEWA